MKKSIFLLMAGVIAVTANGQEALHSSMVYSNNAARNNAKSEYQADNSFFSRFSGSATSAGRTTTGPSPRWYNYAYLQDTIGAAMGQPVIGSSSYMWYSDNAVFYYSSGYGTNNEVSVGTIFDPAAGGFNTPSYFPTGIMAITETDAYTVDSFAIAGFYKRNDPAISSSVVDTLRIAYTYGTPGGSTSNVPIYRSWGFASTYGTDTIRFCTAYFDSLTNKAAQKTGGTTPVYVQDILLTNADTTGTYNKSFAMTTPVSAAALQKIAMSITFKSGDARAYPGGSAAAFSDTVYRNSTSSTTPYKYGAYRQLFYASSDVSGSIAWPSYGYPNDLNVGLTQLEPAGRPTGQNIYFPSYLINESGSASHNQYPFVAFHVSSCPTCVTVGTPSLYASKVFDMNSINVFPNPANNMVRISFNLVQNSSVEASLTNMVGQVVATQHLDNVVTGKADFNTSALPAGMYIYTLKANGETKTGTVAIAH